MLVHLAWMNWKRMLAYVTGSVDEELLARNEYLATENRILRNQIRGRIRLTDPERISLASAAKRLGRKALEEVVQIVRPETILAWHRRLIAKKFDGSKNRSPGRGGSARDEIEELVLRLARENPSWGYPRIAGALDNLGHEVSHQMVANLLKRHAIAPAPERRRTMSWRQFIRSHRFADWQEQRSRRAPPSRGQMRFEVSVPPSTIGFQMTTLFPIVPRVDEYEILVIGVWSKFSSHSTQPAFVEYWAAADEDGRLCRKSWRVVPTRGHAAEPLVLH